MRCIQHRYCLIMSQRDIVPAADCTSAGTYSLPAAAGQQVESDLERRESGRASAWDYTLRNPVTLEISPAIPMFTTYSSLPLRRNKDLVGPRLGVDRKGHKWRDGKRWLSRLCKRLLFVAVSQSKSVSIADQSLSRRPASELQTARAVIPCQ